MNQLPLSPLGVDATLTIEGEFRVFPAANHAVTAPVIVLVDENHLAQPAIDQNARDVAQIVQLMPDIPVVLEHFLAGKHVDRTTQRTYGGSNFHLRLLDQIAAKLVGGDNKHGLEVGHELAEEYEIRIADLTPLVLRPDASTSDHHSKDVTAEKRAIEREAAEALRKLPEQKLRSKSLIETAIKEAEQGRFAVINAGSNHNSHIIENVEWDGSPICPAREELSFVRIRPTHALRLLAAYYRWIDGGMQPDQALDDWLWAESNIPGVN